MRRVRHRPRFTGSGKRAAVIRIGVASHARSSRRSPNSLRADTVPAAAICSTMKSTYPGSMP
ncbi:hypothetical protein WS84_18545 [Burkholderia anthina]|nr:hypothetical protein WS84_18545 [Burkholderia anthina]OXI14739.1 hypothetical protein CFB35_31410 [Burkholderia sp. AU16482]KVH12887.1 hypothetical protein WS85_00285 [Burkholderia anthina]KVM84102.1 hypothetical protein WT06_30020 [Burkholderia anthina]KVN65425.1 hypothetical protein WT13_07015 [Burkholderia anthina]